MMKFFLYFDFTKKTIQQEVFFSFETFFGSYTISKLDKTSNPNVVENDGRMTYIDYVCNSPFVVLWHSQCQEAQWVKKIS